MTCVPDPPAPVAPVTACPACSAALQATRVVDVFYTFKDGLWQLEGAMTKDIRYYCANDCVLSADAYPFPQFPKEEDPKWLLTEL